MGEPMHPRPSCYWEEQTKAATRRKEPPVRIANIFHRDHPVRLVLQLRGYTTDVDRIAAEIAARNP
ncbi:MAG: hypothetical protein RLZZ127_1995 [Planctomycetota bacterium]|jgi:hypothetical protein